MLHDVFGTMTHLEPSSGFEPETPSLPWICFTITSYATGLRVGKLGVSTCDFLT